MAKKRLSKENQSLLQLLESNDITNISLVQQLLKGVEMNPALLSLVMVNSFFNKNGTARTKLKSVVRKHLNKEVYKKCSTILKGEKIDYPTSGFGNKVNKFLEALLLEKENLDLKLLGESVLERTGEGYLFCLEQELVPIKKAMGYILKQKSRYKGENGRFFIRGKYAQQEINTLSELSEKNKFSLISITQPKGVSLDFPDSFKNVLYIQRVMLQGFEEIPPILASIKIDQLEVDSTLKKMPKDVQFSQLNYLSVYTPPENLENAISIEKLTFRFSTINSLPDSLIKLPKLKALRFLNVRDSDYEVLFGGLSELSQLEVLSLDGCQMKRIPESIGKLTNLIELDLKGNQLEQLPITFAQLEQLTYLNISQNWFPAFPDEIVEMTHIEKVRYWHCTRGGMLGRPKNKAGKEYDEFYDTTFL